MWNIDFILKICYTYASVMPFQPRLQCDESAVTDSVSSSSSDVFVFRGIPIPSVSFVTDSWGRWTCPLADVHVTDSVTVRPIDETLNCHTGKVQGSRLQEC